MTRLILIGTARNFPSAVARFGILATVHPSPRRESRPRITMEGAMT